MIIDNRTGEAYDYTKKRGIEHCELLMPAGSDWTPSRSEFWNAVESKNKRADAQVAREFVIALPVELNSAERKALALEFAQYIADTYGVAADVAIHVHKGKKDTNPHAHILTTTNRIEGHGFGNKARELDLVAHTMGGKIGKENAIDHLRQRWEKLANATLERAGIAPGLTIEPLTHRVSTESRQIHIGPKVPEMEQRGIKTERGDLALEIEMKNEAIAALQSDLEAARNERDYEDSPSTQPRADSRGIGTAGRELGDTGRPSELEEYYANRWKKSNLIDGAYEVTQFSPIWGKGESGSGSRQPV